MTKWPKGAICIALALASLRAASAVTEDDKRVILAQWQKANVAFDAQRFADAVDDLGPALKIVPGNPFMREKRGEAEMYLSRWHDAETDLTVAIDGYGARREAARPLAMRAVVWRVEGFPDRALQDDERVVVADPDSPEGHHALATDLEFVDPGRALAESSRSIELRPDFVLGHALHASLIARTGQLAQARRELDDAIATGTRTRHRQEVEFALMQRSLVALELGDAQAARDDAHRAPADGFVAAASLDESLASVFIGDIPGAAGRLRALAQRDPAVLREQDGQWWTGLLTRVTSAGGARAGRAQVAWGMVCAARSDAAGADRHFELAVAADPGVADDVRRAREVLRNP